MTAQRGAVDILRVLQRQAREDAAFEAEVRAVAAMSDAELDAELREGGQDPAEVERQARAIWEAVGLPWHAPGAPVQAVAAYGAPVLEHPARRRRPGAVVLWLAAAAVATGGGAAIYASLHHGPEAPAPPPPSPAPSAPPVASVAPDLVATESPAQLRARAARDLAGGRPEDCLRFLDDAKRLDPAGDARPEVRALRQRASDALGPKPPLKP